LQSLCRLVWQGFVPDGNVPTDFAGAARRMQRGNVVSVNNPRNERG